MDLNIKSIITVTMTLFAVIDIIGSIPVIIQIRQKAGSIHPEKATVVAFLIITTLSVLIISVPKTTFCKDLHRIAKLGPNWPSLAIKSTKIASQAPNGWEP